MRRDFRRVGLREVGESAARGLNERGFLCGVCQSEYHECSRLITFELVSS